MPFPVFASPGENILFMVLLAALMVPGQVTIIPIYLMMADLGLVNTHESLILPGLGERLRPILDAPVL